jgi:AraC-like DNA-binding protein
LSYAQGMNLVYPIRSRRLADFVSFLWYSAGYRPPHAAERVLPTGAMDLVLDLGDPHSCGGVFSGPRSTPFCLDTSGPLTLIGARFTAGGGFAFCDVPAGELQNCTLSLHELWQHDAERLREDLSLASGGQLRLRLLESFLLQRLNRASERHPAVQLALRVLHDPRHSMSVTQITARTGLRAARFIAVFRDQVGLTPKLYSRLMRFRRVIGAIQTRAGDDWASIALDSGYYDQAHLNHDFRAFSGTTPSAYLRDRTSHPNHVRVA